MEQTAACYQLCEAHTLVCAVSLRTPPTGRRGIFVGVPTRAGEPLLAVPWALALSADIGDETPTPDGVLSYHVAVAAELLRATTSASDDAIPEGQRFWREWSRTMLPQPADLTHPATLAPRLLTEVQDEKLVDTARLRRARVASRLEGAWEGVGRVDGTGVGDVWPHWAFAMVSSRPFRFGPPNQRTHRPRLPDWMHSDLVRPGSLSCRSSIWPTTMRRRAPRCAASAARRVVCMRPSSSSRCVTSRWARRRPSHTTSTRWALASSSPPSASSHTSRLQTTACRRRRALSRRSTRRRSTPHWHDSRRSTAGADAGRRPSQLASRALIGERRGQLELLTRGRCGACTARVAGGAAAGRSASHE